jgi:hypothetical protein
MYHRYVKIPKEHKKPSCFFYEPSQSEVVFVPKTDLDQSVIDWIESFEVIVSNVTEGIYTPPNQGKVHIHNDTSTITNATKINFTWGPDTSTTRWWNVKDESFLKTDITDSSHITETVKPDIVDHFDSNGVHKELICESEDQCELVCEKVINQPSLINVGQLHSTYNPDPVQGRWSLCYFLLDKDYKHLQFEKALNIFKEVTYE